jgi:hypothetical protein
MNWMKDLPERSVAAIKAETAGETVHWAAKPHAGRAFWRGLGAWGMGIPWTALMGAIFAVLVAAIFSGKPPLSEVTVGTMVVMAILIVMSGAFLAIGLAMMAVPFWAHHRANRTVYAITNRRIVTIVQGARATQVQSVKPHAAVRLQRTERKDGSGTLRIVTGNVTDSDGDTTEVAEELFAVPNVREAERLIDGLRTQI